MSGETTLTIIGNLTADPELSFTPSGAAVANFTVAATPRNYNKQTGEWEDGNSLFMRCTVWRQMAENVAESLKRGHRVIVTGRLQQRSYETKEGEKRTVVELQVDEVAPSLRYVQVNVRKVERSGQGQYDDGQQRQQQRPAGQPGQAQRGQWSNGQSTQQPVQDPWSSEPPRAPQGGYADAPPF